MRHTLSALWITRRLLTIAALVTATLLLSACDTAPKQAAEDAPSSSAGNRTSRADAAKGMKIRVETRYLLLDEDTLGSVLADLDDNPIEIEAPADGNAPAEAYLLNDVQVDLLIRAIQASRNSTSLVPSRLTVSPGESAWVRVGDQPADAEPDQANNDKARPPFDPDRPGITFQGGGTVTADRRHIDLDFRSQLVTEAGSERQAESSWEAAGRAKIPDQATLLLVGNEIPGTVNLGDKQPANNNAGPDKKRRPVLFIHPSIVMQQARR